MKRLLLLILVALLFAGIHVASAQPYVNNAAAPTDPAHRPLPATERGVLLEQKYEDSKIYPGTSRTIKVFVPKAYDGKTPACRSATITVVCAPYSRCLPERLIRWPSPAVRCSC